MTHDVHALAVVAHSVIGVELVGEVAERGFVVHAAVVEVAHVVTGVEPLSDEIVAKRREARGAVGISVHD